MPPTSAGSWLAGPVPKQLPEHPLNPPTSGPTRQRDRRTGGADRHEQAHTRFRPSSARRTAGPGPRAPGRSRLQQPVGERGTSERSQCRVHPALRSPGRRRRPGMDRIPGSAARPVPQPARCQWQPRHPRPAWRSGSPGLVARWIPDCLRAKGRDGRAADLDHRPTGFEPATAGEGVSRQAVEPFLGQPGLVARWIADRDGWIRRRPADGTARTIGAGNRHRGIRRGHGRGRARVIRWPPA